MIFSTVVKKNPHHGVGILILSDLQASFKIISERICSAEFNVYQTEKSGHETNIEVVFVCAYAPTLVQTNKDINVTENFYKDLENYIASVSKKKLLIVAGDFNAKTGSSNSLYPQNIGLYGKGYTNTNGEFLVETAVRNNLILSNTFFKHKLCHITTWESPDFTNKKHTDGTIRRNPYRNQIDYILTRSEYKQFIVDSRSYNGLSINTDHRIVICKFKNIHKYLVHKNNTKKKDNFAIENINNTNHRIKYQRKVQESLEEIVFEQLNPIEKWKKIKETTTEAAKEVFGNKEKKKNYIENEEIRKLSIKQKELHNNIQSCKNKTKRILLKAERNRYLNDLHRLKAQIEEEKLQYQISEIERLKDDSRRMFSALKYVNSRRKKTKYYYRKWKRIYQQYNSKNRIYN